VTVIGADPGDLPALVSGLEGDDLLVALAEAPPPDRHLLPMGIAGAGFDGNLTSDSTRTEGVVLSTDLAPTILDRFGIAVPDEMNGSEIRAEGDADAADVADLQERLSDRPSRDTVLLLPLAAWALLAAVASLALGSRGARVALPLLALACAWAPLMLLAGAAADPGELGEALIAGVGSVVLAALAWRLAPGLPGLAIACLVTVAAHAVDVLAGSPLTALSVLGPNPAGGVRFFGIGNELEAVLTTLTLVGAGAWFATRPRLEGRRLAVGFGVAATLAGIAFAPGRFGADVGAAIVLAAGGGAAAALALDFGRRRTALMILGLPVLGLAALVAADLVLGGAHLTRSVLGAGDTGDLADVLDRRLTLTLRSFTDPVYPQLLVLAVILLAVGAARRDRILSWLEGRPAALYGYLGALAGILVGTAANDSGAILLVIGTILLAAFAGFFWATSAPRPASVPGSRR
jgi:hypothetical protein